MTEADDGKWCAVLSWLFPIGLIWYLVDEKMKKNKFAEFHVKQSLILVILAIAIGIGANIVPFIGRYVISPVGGLIVLILWIFGLIKAFSGKKDELPVIGQLSKNFKF